MGSARVQAVAVVAEARCNATILDAGRHGASWECLCGARSWPEVYRTTYGASLAWARHVATCWTPTRKDTTDE